MSWCYPGRILRLWETYAVTSSDCEGPSLPNIILVIITRRRGRSYINLLSISQYCKLTVAPLVTSLANLKIQSSWQMLCGLESSSRLSWLKRLNEEAWRSQENIFSVLTSRAVCFVSSVNAAYPRVMWPVSIRSEPGNFHPRADYLSVTRERVRTTTRVTCADTLV